MNQGNPPPYPGPGPTAPYPPYPPQPMGPGPMGGPYPPPQGYPYQGYPQYGWQGGPQEPPKTTGVCLSICGYIVLCHQRKCLHVFFGREETLSSLCNLCLMSPKLDDGLGWILTPEKRPKSALPTTFTLLVPSGADDFLANVFSEGHL